MKELPSNYVIPTVIEILTGAREPLIYTQGF